MYELVAQNLAKTCKRNDSSCPIPKNKLQSGDLVLRNIQQAPLILSTYMIIELFQLQEINWK